MFRLHRWIPSVAVSVIAAALLLFAAACGDGELTLAEYFQKLEATQDENSARDAAFEAKPTPGPQSTGEELAAYLRDFFNNRVDVDNATLDALNKLDPPAEVEDEHNEFVAGVTGTREVFQRALDQIPDSLSLDEADKLFTDFASPGPAGQRVKDACLALRKVADDNNVQTNLTCEVPQ